MLTACSSQVSICCTLTLWACTSLSIGACNLQACRLFAGACSTEACRGGQISDTKCDQKITWQCFFFVHNAVSTVRAPVFGRHQFFGTSAHYRKAHGSVLSGWMNYNYTACCWFPTSSNILILPSQFWQIRFESCWLHCSKCRILVLLRYITFGSIMKIKKMCGC